MLRNDNACAVAARVVDDVYIRQIKLVIVAHADCACRCAGNPAAGKRVFLVCRDIGLLPGVAAIVKDERTGFVNIIIAGTVRTVAVSDGKDGRFCVLVAHGDEEDTALNAICQTERVPVQAKRDLRAVLRHAERLFQRKIVRQIIAAGFQRAAGHGQRYKGWLFTAVFAVYSVNMVLFAVFCGCFCVLGGCIRFFVGSGCSLRRSFLCDRFFCGRLGIRCFIGSLVCFLRVRRDGADTPNSQHQRKHQQQADPSLSHSNSSSYYGVDYVYQESSIFFSPFQRFSHVLSKY